MATKIEWTDETWNPLRARRISDGKVGWHCELASPGCQHCYAQTFNGRELPNGGTGLSYTRGSRDQVETFVDPAALVKPIGWKKPKRIFTCSMTDLFGEWVTDDQIDRVFAVMNACHITLPASEKSTRWHRFQVLTKRAERMHDYMESRSTTHFRQGEHPLFKVRGEVFRGCGSDVMNAGACLQWPLPNVEFGVSAENQEWYDKRIRYLLETPAASRFISAEPLLGPIVLKVPCRDCHALNGLNVVRCCHCGAELPSLDIDWLIIGGESGAGARPCELKWIRSLVVQCSYAGIAVYVKQLGSNCIEVLKSQTQDASLNRRLRLKHPKGGDWNEWPADLHIREFPEVKHG